MTLEIIKLMLGPIQTNCYIVGDTEAKAAIVIDPVDRAELIHKTAQDAGWTIREILATHGHFDHVMASAKLVAATGAPFRIHQLDLHMLEEMPQRVKAWLGIEVRPAAQPDGFVEEGDTITVGAITLDVLFTPGHSPGHVSYVLAGQQAVFSGDVLFHGSIGRTDLPGSDYETLMQSITNKLLPLGDEVTVLPGHMQNTLIGYERQYNHFVVEYLNRDR